MEVGLNRRRKKVKDPTNFAENKETTKSKGKGGMIDNDEEPIEA